MFWTRYNQQYICEAIYCGVKIQTKNKTTKKKTNNIKYNLNLNTPNRTIISPFEILFAEFHSVALSLSRYAVIV